MFLKSTKDGDILNKNSNKQQEEELDGIFDELADLFNDLNTTDQDQTKTS